MAGVTDRPAAARLLSLDAFRGLTIAAMILGPGDLPEGLRVVIHTSFFLITFPSRRMPSSITSGRG
jgi:predicted acyltransferase